MDKLFPKNRVFIMFGICAELNPKNQYITNKSQLLLHQPPYTREGSGLINVTPNARQRHTQRHSRSRTVGISQLGEIPEIADRVLLNNTFYQILSCPDSDALTSIASPKLTALEW